jgi:Fic family protein
LLSSYKQNKKIKFPIQSAFDFHFSFERIHPFQNGNGRVGRFLMNKILQTNNFMPMIILEQNREKYFNSFVSVIERNKKKYYKFLLEQYLLNLSQIDN